MPGEKKHRVGTTSSMQLFAVLYGCIQVFSLQNWIDSFIEFSRLKIRQKANNSQRCIKLQPRFNIIYHIIYFRSHSSFACGTFTCALSSHLISSSFFSSNEPMFPQNQSLETNPSHTNPQPQTLPYTKFPNPPTRLPSHTIHK